MSQLSKKQKGSSKIQTKKESKKSSPQNQSANNLSPSTDKMLSPLPAEEMLTDARFNHSTHRALRTDYMSALQHVYGNGHVQRMLDSPQGHSAPDIQRGLIEDSLSWLDTQSHNAMEATGLETAEEAERGRAQAFYAHGLYGPKTYIATAAAGRGGFDVTFDPVGGIEKITIRCVVDFKDGLTISGGVVTPGHSDLNGRAVQAAALTGADQTAFISQYQWTPEQQIPWLTRLKSSVEGAWGSAGTGLSFFINKPDWDWITANVVLDVQVRAGDTRRDNEHLFVSVYKEPTGQSDVGAEVNKGAEDNAFDQNMTLSSSDIDPRSDNMLAGGNDRTVFFGHDSDVIDPTQQAKLNTWIATYQGDPTNSASNTTEVTLVGFTSASGSDTYNLDLSVRRTEAVRNYLNSNGFTNVNTRVAELGFGEAGAKEGASEAEQAQERRVELIVDSGEAQVVANHEFGHAFGMSDEYATADTAGNPNLVGSSSGGRAGVAAAHDPLVRNMTDASGTPLPGAIRENTDGIMSLGNTVEPQHYSTFHDALVQVSGISEWSINV